MATGLSRTEIEASNLARNRLKALPVTAMGREAPIQEWSLSGHEPTLALFAADVA
jgi:hypothetical protein